MLLAGPSSEVVSWLDKARFEFLALAFTRFHFDGFDFFGADSQLKQMLRPE
jgi:hypothetical protein